MVICLWLWLGIEFRGWFWFLVSGSVDCCYVRGVDCDWFLCNGDLGLLVVSVWVWFFLVGGDFGLGVLGVSWWLWRDYGVWVWLLVGSGVVVIRGSGLDGVIGCLMVLVLRLLAFRSLCSCWVVVCELGFMIACFAWDRGCVGLVSRWLLVWLLIVGTVLVIAEFCLWVCGWSDFEWLSWWLMIHLSLVVLDLVWVVDSGLLLIGR